MNDFFSLLICLCVLRLSSIPPVFFHQHRLTMTTRVGVSRLADAGPVEGRLCYTGYHPRLCLHFVSTKHSSLWNVRHSVSGMFCGHDGMSVSVDRPLSCMNENLRLGPRALRQWYEASRLRIFPATF